MKLIIIALMGAFFTQNILADEGRDKAVDITISSKSYTACLNIPYKAIKSLELETSESGAEVLIVSGPCHRKFGGKFETKIRVVPAN